MSNINLSSYKRIYFCGICGVSMSALAKHLSLNGKIVGGSDKAFGEQAKELSLFGIKVYKDNLDKHLIDFKPDLVVYTSAISDDNQELTYAKSKGIPIIKRSQLLGEIVRSYNKSIAVCGSHGKTTTTSMLARIFIKAGLDPTVFLGGFDSEMGNYRKGKSKIVIFEACEYQRNFLDVFPTHTLVLNIDNDHLDTYKTIDQVKSAFSDFVKDTLCVTNADDLMAVTVQNQTSVTFGINNLSNYMAKEIILNDKGSRFSLFRNGFRICKIDLSVFGLHNVYNALSACAMAGQFGISDRVIITALKEFFGVKRRMELLGDFNHKICVADYAHHPSEINATINSLSLSESCEQNDLFVFQPHTYSRTQLLFDDFISVLSKIKNLIVYKTYPAREPYKYKGSAKYLFKQLKKHSGNNILYANSTRELREEILAFDGCKRVIFLGAGDIYDVAKKLINKS